MVAQALQGCELRTILPFTSFFYVFMWGISETITHFLATGCSTMESLSPSPRLVCITPDPILYKKPKLLIVMP
jgi:hypothetical protein